MFAKLPFCCRDPKIDNEYMTEGKLKYNTACQNFKKNNSDKSYLGFSQ